MQNMIFNKEGLLYALLQASDNNITHCQAAGD
jgi:hypothetical protein